MPSDAKGGFPRFLSGPKSFINISDPLIAMLYLHVTALSFGKGILAKNVERIMHKGCLPIKQQMHLSRPPLGRLLLRVENV